MSIRWDKDMESYTLEATVTVEPLKPFIGDDEPDPPAIDPEAVWDAVLNLAYLHHDVCVAYDFGRKEAYTAAKPVYEQARAEVRRLLGLEAE